MNSGFVTYLPDFLRQKIEGHHNLQKILDNIGWLFLDKILRAVVGAVVCVLMARYLGPKEFGQFNYVIAFVALFGVVATVGLDGIVVRDLVTTPDETLVTLGSAFVLQLIFSLFTSGTVIVAILFLRPGDHTILVLVSILGLTLVFKSCQVVKYWFESQIQSRYFVWVENGVFLVMAATKVVLICLHAPLIAFVWVLLVEAIVVAGGLLAIYNWRTKTLRYWQVKLSRVKKLLRDSWPLILSSLAIMIYMRIDQIMLGQMMGDKAVGVYSAALSVSEVWYMVPVILSASFFPTIIESKQISEDLYKKRIQSLLSLMVTLALAIALLVTLSARFIIVLLFGNNYIDAAPVLMVHIWAGLFVFMGVVGGRWFLTENLQHLTFYRTASGAVANVVLNFFFIPKYGILGAAIATVASQMLSSYLLDLINVETLCLFRMKTISLFSFLLIFKFVNRGKI